MNVEELYKQASRRVTERNQKLKELREAKIDSIFKETIENFPDLIAKWDGKVANCICTITIDEDDVRTGLLRRLTDHFGSKFSVNYYSNLIYIYFK